MTDLIFKIVSSMYGFYPIRKYALKRIENYFLNYHVKTVLEEASAIFEISDYQKASDLSKKSPFRGVMSEFVRVGDFCPNPKDIAVAINVSMYAFCNEKTTNIDSIIDLAFHISNEIKTRLLSDPLLKSVLNDIDKDIGQIQTQGSRKEIEELFTNKKELFLSYYSTFNKPEFGYSIKVWHQIQGNDYIDWNEEAALTVNLNPMRIREGFFLSGFDYFCNQRQTRLQYATKLGGYEYFDSEDGGSLIWAR
ncbi:hypothetical protein BCU90_00605 [Vibrio lentus]|uniref:hypothetical protein n=1 Tax=Vibrio TaxID=662 RepID=UPI000C857374|nr:MULTISPECIES: hypothetical protein [Vibrio]PMG49157.1 hypothetical protein BCU90_00605 [Vibrio lentus]PTP67368.1 hypothetical protein CWO31_06885 [Vibrio splendidus]